MNNELAIERFGYNKKDRNDNNVMNKLKTIGNDSLFYFALFMLTLTFLHVLPYVGGIFTEINIGINEVLVSAVGFANVFFLQVFNKMFRKAS